MAHNQAARKQHNDQAHPPPASYNQLPAEPKSWKNDNTAGGRVQRLVVLLLYLFATRNLNAAPERPSRARPKTDAAKYHLTRPHISGQSTACLTHRSRRSDTTMLLYRARAA